MTDVEWTHDSVLRLVEEYKQHRELWDSTHELYRVQTAKYAAWAEMATTFDCDISDLRKKINSILASHRREKMRIRCGGQSTWFLYNYLRFLPHHLENVGAKATNQEAEEEQPAWEDENQVDEDDEEEDDDIHQIIIKEEPEPAAKVPSKPQHEYIYPVHKPRLPRKRKIIRSPTTSGGTKIENVILETLKILRRSNITKKKDECDSFGEYIADSLRKHDERTQAMIKQAINNILFEQEMKKYSSGHYEIVISGVDENPLILGENHHEK